MEKERLNELRIQSMNQLRILNWAFDISWDMLANKEESIFKLGKNTSASKKSEIYILDQFKILWHSGKTDEKLFKYIIRIFYTMTNYSKLTSEEKFPLIFKLNDYDLATIMCVCDVISRTMMGQITELFDLKDHYFEIRDPKIIQMKHLMFPELSPNAYYAIHSPEISDDARILVDIYQVIRFYLSWRDQKNTPATRDWRTQLTVNYDNPHHLSQEPLIEVKELIDE